MSQLGMRVDDQNVGTDVEHKKLILTIKELVEQSSGQAADTQRVYVLAKASRDQNELLDIIEGLVRQDCGNDSQAITAYRDAMHILADAGRCTVLKSVGRRVIVEWPSM